MSEAAGKEQLAESNGAVHSAEKELIRYIIIMKDGEVESEVADIAKDLLGSAGISAEIKEVYKFLNAFVVELTVEQAEIVGTNSRVISIEQDGVTPELPLPSEPQLEQMDRSDV